MSKVRLSHASNAVDEGGDAQDDKGEDEDLDEKVVERLIDTGETGGVGNDIVDVFGFCCCRYCSCCCHRRRRVLWSWFPTHRFEMTDCFQRLSAVERVCICALYYVVRSVNIEVETYPRYRFDMVECCMANARNVVYASLQTSE